ncbi:MAG: sugar ABC transporter substrate-binding protein [Firmicutes bacterium HGW-Firmicutes-7]|nr:MAG: sugar ABC transporter substrate-binding protein [Firmicutes bacterium HGW-Firmicutes-7]
MKKLITLLLALVLVLGTTVGCGKKEETPNTEVPNDGAKKVEIGVSIANFDDTFLTNVMDGMKAIAAENPNINLEFVDAKEDMGKQMDQVENFAIQQKDAIIVVPVDTSAAGPLTSAAVDAGIPIVYVNRNPGNLPQGAYYVGSDSIVAGRLQMEFLAEKLGGEGNYAILMGKLDNEASLQRTAGNKEINEQFPGIKLLDEQTGQWQRTEGMRITEDWVNKFGDDLNAILANNDDMGLGAIQALKDSGRTDVIVLGVDATADAVAAVEAGDMAATVFQNAKGQGGGAIDAAFKAATGVAVDQEVWIPYELITPENIGDYK